MSAAFLSIAFTAAALLAATVIAVSLVKGFAAAASLRRQLALCSDEREVTIRHVRPLPRGLAEAGFNPMRVSRRTVRPVAPLPAAQRRLVAA